ncbi:ABC transporter substrate-binding protein [Flavobacterium sp. P4023]|uniref:ABC transporter substrate-binding protein n=1 Tax=Flavobacterium flabelliforme TaxID=2816119 RepID=A0ABS5CT58_9FLAO|nr:ABC transporter substrate-binding protein [Flavobacterium flabelliforme]MBP4141794.1 ABC transporter substrate-binding protein [Flavobacterium flabelliforme]
MKLTSYKILLLLVLSTFVSCKKTEKSENKSFSNAKNEIEYASNLAIFKQEGYSIVKIINPWPNADKDFTYILKEKNVVVPDSLQKYNTIQVPLQSIVVTSTTIIPYLEMLGVENHLVGFPHTDYISSLKTRKLIDNGSVKNVGQNEKLNMEQLIEMSPELIVTFGIDNNNPMIDNLQKSGLKVLIQADWMEQSPLGKAEWIKLYGALFGKEKEAKTQFDDIIKNYKEAMNLVSTKKPTANVLYGSMYQDQWYVAKANSWVAQFLKDAKANYLWADTEGTGSIGLSFEKVLEKAKNANFWIATGPFKTVAELENVNPHYSQFDAFKTKQVYTFEGKIGATGGTIYYESAPSRPDLVLKDYIKIFHPELLPNYTFTFAQKLN